MRNRTAAFPLALLLLTAATMNACGQKGPLYKPDDGIAVAPAASVPSPVVPAPATSSDGTAAPVTPASPDRSDEERKRIPENPAPAQSR
jgi:predicted small lipoprotein YifL